MMNEVMKMENKLIGKKIVDVKIAEDKLAMLLFVIMVRSWLFALMLIAARIHGLNQWRCLR